MPRTKQHPRARVTDDAAADNFAARITQFVAKQTPRLFAVVIEHQDHNELVIDAWGMDFNGRACMVTAHGNTYYSIASATNALNYVRTGPGATPHLIWTTPTPTSTN